MEPASAFALAKKAQEGAEVGWKLWKWYQHARYPKAKGKEIGIVIAIAAEGEQIFNQIQNDLVRSLEKLADARSLERPFKIIPLPIQHQKRIRTKDDAERALHKCRSKLLIWGQAKPRSIDDKEYVVLEFDAIATHGLVVQEVSEIFATEMRELIPARVLVSKGNNLLEMELSAFSLDLAAHYIVAVSSYLSDDKEYSLELFQALAAKLGRIDLTDLPDALKSHVALLRKKTRLNIVHIWLGFVRDAHLKWRKTRDIKYLERSYECAKKAEALLPNLYQTAITGSIYAFVVEGDVRKARKLLQGWAAVEDATWAFNMAFLHAYEGNLAAASRFYKQGMRRSTNSEVTMEIEEFLEWMLLQHPEKYQFHYLLGMMLFVGREELSFGRQHFQHFVDAVPEGQFVSQVQEAKKYLDPAFKKPKSLLATGVR